MKRKAKLPFDPKVFLAKWARENDIQIPEGSNCFLTRRGRGRGFLHPARRGQAHCRFRARQGSGGELDPATFLEKDV